MLGNKRDYTLWNKRGYTSSLERTAFESAAKSSPRTSCLERADTEYKISAFLLWEVFWSPHVILTSMFTSILSTLSWKCSLFTIISTGFGTSHTILKPLYAYFTLFLIPARRIQVFPSHYHFVVIIELKNEQK